MCCKCYWRRCGCCVPHLFPIRLGVIACAVMDMFVMIWFIFVVLRIKSNMTSCCGIASSYLGGVNSNVTDLVSYQTCTSISFLDNVITTYEDIFSHPKSFSDLSQLVTFSNVNVTVANDGGCIVDHTNCLSSGIESCVAYVK